MMDIDSFWEYSDPAASEERFQDALNGSTGDEHLELMTQVARTYSLRGRFAEAHQLLDQVEPQLSRVGARPRARYELERGRTYNSGGQKEKAVECFRRAWEIAQDAFEEGLAVDAAHMLAIASSGQNESLEWTQQGLALARRSQDPKARSLIPAMLNNAAWDLHDQGRYREALPLFEEALAEWTSSGRSPQILIARWGALSRPFPSSLSWKLPTSKPGLRMVSFTRRSLRICGHWSASIRPGHILRKHSMSSKGMNGWSRMRQSGLTGCRLEPGRKTENELR